MLKSSIAPSAVQTLFDSAANAAEKGQAQWFTPIEWARVLSLPLNEYRPVITDLTCGNGQLLRGAVGSPQKQKSALLGCDLDSSVNVSPHAVSADITRFYPLLCSVNCRADMFVLNPPWDLHWYRSNLDQAPAKLSESECPAVRAAFAAHDGRTSRDTIDSTIATLCIALDRLSAFGEGFLIGNEATLQRLLFAKNAPHAALAQHIWAHIAIEGNLCDNKTTGKWKLADAGNSNSQFPSRSSFYTGVIWFARDHSSGPGFEQTLTASGIRPDDKDLLGLARRVCSQIQRERISYRRGAWAAAYLHTENTVDLWLAAREEQLRLDGTSEQPPFNVWFDADAGVIRTYLNLFDTASGRVDKTQAAALHALNGRQPIQLVVQRSQRQALLDAVKGGPTGTVWSVDSALQAAVDAAITEYNRVRAPLYPLPKIQRLGYLDEQDDILCCKSLGNPAVGHFVAGRRYFLRSTTIATKRSGTKVNNIGLLDDVEWNGQELAFFITDESGVERCFMERRLREENVKLNLIRPGAKGRRERDLQDECAIDFTLQELVEHFVIPEVPDVATRFPQQYETHRQTMRDIAKLVTGFKFKKFQLDDYARAALNDGVILGHDTGLGKTIAMFIWPLLKLGFMHEALDTGQVTHASRLRPNAPVLLVVPGDGHDQTEDEAWKHFKIRKPTGMIRLDSQSTFLRLAKPNPCTGRFTLEPRYYLTSYTQLTGNGVAEFPPLDRLNPEDTMVQLNLKESDAMAWWEKRGQIYARDYERLKVTPDSSWKEIENSFKQICRTASDKLVIESAKESLHVLKRLTPLSALLQWKSLNAEQQLFIRSELIITRHIEFSAGIGETRNGIKCIYSPSLADLCGDCFAACVIDEGTKIKGDETIIGTGVRSINATFRLVLTATPIKNRFPDLFHLAHYVCGGHDEPTARFPYGKVDKQDFADEFLVSERNLTKEKNSAEKRRFIKFTPQVCNVHRAWKLLAPIILRRRKNDCGEDIVPKLRHVVRVPMGLYQAAAYQFHLKARYQDCNGRPAVGAQLQALRIAAANPASELLKSPTASVGKSHRSQYSFIPKAATALSLIQQILERGEQAIMFGAFNDSLDVISARLREAGVKHLVLDGRISQAKRGQLARLFKMGPPRALKEGLSSQQSAYPLVLAGAECMAELHSFPLCNNVILTAYSWAWDKFEQAINRAHRLNSPWPVNVWSIICDGSIDRRLEANIHEKGDAAQLVLDGHLLGENPTEVNLAELLQIAQEDFSSVKTIDECELEKDWPRLRAALGKAFLRWNKNNKQNLTAVRPSSPQPIEIDLPLWRQRLL